MPKLRKDDRLANVPKDNFLAGYLQGTEDRLAGLPCPHYVPYGAYRRAYYAAYRTAEERAARLQAATHFTVLTDGTVLQNMENAR